MDLLVRRERYDVQPYAPLGEKSQTDMAEDDVSSD